MQELASVPATNPFLHESEVTSPAGTAASPASTINSMQEVDYFTAKAVPIRASIAGRPAAIGPLTSSPSPFSPRSAHDSVLITPSQFPPPPGHAHPSVVFRKPPTPLAAAAVRDTSSSRISRYASPRQTVSLVFGGRESVMSTTPSLFPQPPSANGKDAHIRPLFAAAAAARNSTLSSSSSSSLAGPTPPPKEYHPTLSPITNDYFSPLAPTVTSVQAPTSPRQQSQQPPPPPTATAGITRITKPVPLDLMRETGGNAAAASSPDLPPLPPRDSLSPISPHSPVLNPALSPLTIRTLTHLSNTALRSPNLMFVEQPGCRPSHADSTASSLTSAQRDRLREMKRAYDERQGQYERGGDEEKGGWMTKQRERGGGGVRTYLWVGIAIRREVGKVERLDL
ncbi:hypothetical protein BKA67DRAFT_537751 [Truncatella angustata]|uniref:Uncharacterized protein n=1 Tax=Truncatella angustata TaxID=152316 RepID=A0A9P8ZVF0_9PEZI|nr:uncharacterized protein BKA67DRAFT_537751 [Truncatella angustata]KAH6651901.1 hypothetical protein BKA67DRAFT_537751 [Truncatella angustata]